MHRALPGAVMLRKRLRRGRACCRDYAFERCEPMRVVVSPVSGSPACNVNVLLGSPGVLMFARELDLMSRRVNASARWCIARCSMLCET